MVTLLGPPEIYNRKPQSFLTTTSTATATDNAATTIQPQPPMGFTENNSATFLLSGNPCLDFFFHVVPDTPPDSVRERLHVAWTHNPLTTLKLIYNLRGVRGTGKSDRDGFYAAATWLFSNHPKTLAANVPSLADFGYFKDLPEILYRLLEGSDVRKNQKHRWLSAKRSSKRNRLKRKPIKSKPLKKVSDPVVEKEKAHALRGEKKLAMAKRLLDRYKSDENFCLLHDSVSDHFADCLKNDLQNLNSGALTGGRNCDQQ
ncbi:uncharacterized protein [Arachis hypogaea]|uniref:uncharacterized protein n=1 Tax=Arachis hypogaea TaxID=3818 RepID=UPI000DED2DA2|nr:uncharacterized protein LOC112774900 [Arachis hypogaea]QHO56649.1 uncharacterized protein DS421_3g75520 [Arachis hypogaea]